MTTDAEALRAMVERVRADIAGFGAEWTPIDNVDIEALCTAALRVAQVEAENRDLRLEQQMLLERLDVLGAEFRREVGERERLEAALARAHE